MALFRNVLVIVCIWAATTVSGFAQWHFGANIGLASPNGEIEDASTIGVALNLSVMNQFPKTPALSMGLRVHYMGYGNKTYTFYAPGVNDLRTSFTAVGLMLAVEVGAHKGVVRPFIGIAAGPQFMSYDIKIQSQTRTYSDTGFGFAPQLGLRFGVSERVGIELRAVIHRHGKFEVSESGTKLSATANGTEIGLGIRYRL